MRNRKMSILALMLFVGIATPKGAHASPSICDAVAGNLIQNCGFELGTLGSYPKDWTADAGFTLELGVFNFVTPGNVNSGNYALSFGNYDYQGPAGISQTFSDIDGGNYQVTFYAFDGGANGDADAFLKAQINGATEVTLEDTVAQYTEFQFDFTGTGSDTLGFLAQTDPSEWYLDDVSVVGPPALSTTPEPGSLALLVAGLMLVGVITLTRKCHSIPAV
jgi:hypothetical protein